MGRSTRGSGRILTRIVARFASLSLLATASCAVLFSLDDHDGDAGIGGPGNDGGGNDAADNDSGNPPPPDGGKPGDDAGNTDGGPRDTGTDAPPNGCTGGIAFRNAKRIDPAGDTNQFSARAKDNDPNTAFIATDRIDNAVDPGSHIWLASRANSTVEFGTPSRVGGGFGSTGTQRHAVVNRADNRMLYVQALDSGAEEIRLATGSSSSGYQFNSRPWNRTGEYTDTDVYHIQDGVLVYFATNRGAGKFRIYQSLFDGSTYGEQKPVAGLGAAVAADERAPVVTDNGTTIFFARKEGSRLRIRAAQRASIDGSFAEIPVCGLDVATETQYPTWISADVNLIFYIRVVGSSSQLWQASR